MIRSEKILAWVTALALLVCVSCDRDNNSKPPPVSGNRPAVFMREPAPALQQGNSMQCVAFSAWQQMRMQGIQYPHSPERLHDDVARHVGEYGQGNADLSNSFREVYEYLQSAGFIRGWREFKSDSASTAREELLGHMYGVGPVTVATIGGYGPALASDNSMDGCEADYHIGAHSVVLYDYAEPEGIVRALNHYGADFGCGGSMRLPIAGTVNLIQSRHVRAVGIW